MIVKISRMKILKKYLVRSDAVRQGGATEPATEVNLESAQSMASSVTRHALFTQPSEFKLLSHGMDSLDLSIYVDWGMDWELFRIKLDQQKKEAENTNGILFQGLGSHPVLIHPKGKKKLPILAPISRVQSMDIKSTKAKGKYP